MASGSPQQPRALQRDAEAAVEACTTGDVGVLRALLASNGGAIVEWRERVTAGGAQRKRPRVVQSDSDDDLFAETDAGAPRWSLFSSSGG